MPVQNYTINLINDVDYKHKDRHQLIAIINL